MSGVVERSVRVSSHAELAAELAAAFTAFRTQRPRARYVEVPLDLLAETAEATVPQPQHSGPPAPAPAALADAVALLRAARASGSSPGAAPPGRRTSCARWPSGSARPSSRRRTARACSRRTTRWRSARGSTCRRRASGSSAAARARGRHRARRVRRLGSAARARRPARARRHRPAPGALQRPRGGRGDRRRPRGARRDARRAGRRRAGRRRLGRRAARRARRRPPRPGDAVGRVAGGARRRAPRRRDRRRRQRDVLLLRRGRRAPGARPALVPLPDRLRHARLRGAGGDGRAARPSGPARARALRRRRADVHASPSSPPRRRSGSRSRSSCSRTRATARSATRWSTRASRRWASTCRSRTCPRSLARSAARARRWRSPPGCPTPSPPRSAARRRRSSPSPRGRGHDPPAVHDGHLDRPRDRPPGLPRDRPADRRRQRRRAPDARGLHRGRGRRPRARDEPEGGRRLRPRRRYTPFGGAKGGIDCDPYDPDARGILRRYVDAMRPFLERHWATGEDLGLQQDMIDEVFAEAGLRSSIEAALLRLDDPERGLRRLREGFAVDVDGIGLGEMIGGYGVAEAALAALEHLALRAGGDARGRPGLRLDGRRDGALPRAGGRPRGRDRRPARARREPRRARRRGAAARPRRARRDRPRGARPATRSGRAPTGSRSTPSCSCPPRCPT